MLSVTSSIFILLLVAAFATEVEFVFKGTGRTSGNTCTSCKTHFASNLTLFSNCSETGSVNATASLSSSTAPAVLVYSVVFSGLSGSFTGGSLRALDVPQAAIAASSVSPVTSVLSGVTSNQISQLNSGWWIVSVTTSTCPNGAFVGVLKPL